MLWGADKKCWTRKHVKLNSATLGLFLGVIPSAGQDFGKYLDLKLHDFPLVSFMLGLAFIKSE